MWKEDRRDRKSLWPCWWRWSSAPPVWPAVSEAAAPPPVAQWGSAPPPGSPSPAWPLPAPRDTSATRPARPTRAEHTHTTICGYFLIYSVVTSYYWWKSWQKHMKYNLKITKKSEEEGNNPARSLLTFWVIFAWATPGLLCSSLFWTDLRPAWISDSFAPSLWTGPLLSTTFPTWWMSQVHLKSFDLTADISKHNYLI